jgi:hypothetical protein
MRNYQIAAAVATALGVAGTALAQSAPPNPTTAMQAAHNVYMAGSSAAVNGILAWVEGTVCGGTGWTLFTSTTSTLGQPDFRAVSCSPPSGGPVFGGSTLTVWYRPEGGSVVGVFPVANNTAIKQLNISAACNTAATGSSATSATYNCTNIAGTTPQNGTDDSFSVGVSAHTVDVGISDLEPGVFASISSGTKKAWAGGGGNDPNPTYAASFTGGDINVQTAQALTHAIVFEQVFGFMVNTALGVTNLPKEMVAAAFDGTITDWSEISTGTSSGKVASTSTPIVVCNREIGSGTRASTDIFLNAHGCNALGTAQYLTDVAGKTRGGVVMPSDNFATNLEIDCVNRNAESIGYVSIDNYSKFGGSSAPNVTSILVSGITASQVNAATGVYAYVYEASMNENASASSDGTAFYAAAVPVLEAGSTTAKSGQILAIPQYNGNTAQIPLQVGVEPTSLFYRSGSGGGNSCNPLTEDFPTT